MKLIQKAIHILQGVYEHSESGRASTARAQCDRSRCVSHIAHGYCKCLQIESGAKSVSTDLDAPEVFTAELSLADPA